MATAPPQTRKVRIQDAQPGMKIARLTVDLDFVYLPIKRVVPVKQVVNGTSRTVSYKVILEGHLPGTHQDSCYRPFIVRPTQRLDVVTEED